MNTFKAMLDYTKSDIIENFIFPENEVGFDIRFKIINNLTFAVYLHSIFSVCKLEPSFKNITNELVILIEGRYSSGKKLGVKYVVKEETLNKRMVYLKDLNLLVCNMEDYITDNGRDSGFINKEITDIDKYMRAAIRERIVDIGNLPIKFNFNDPTKTYKHVYLSLFNRILEVPIDNNSNEKEIAELYIEYNSFSDKIVFNFEELYNKKKLLYNSDNTEIFLSFNKESVEKYILDSKLHKNQLYSYEVLEQEKEVLKEKFEEERAVLEAKLENIKRSNDLKDQERQLKIAELDNELRKLKILNDNFKVENEKLRNTITSEIEIRKLHLESEKNGLEVNKIESSYKKMDSDEKINELKLKKEETTTVSSNISNYTKIAAIAIPLITSCIALYKIYSKEEDVIFSSTTNNTDNCFFAFKYFNIEKFFFSPFPIFF